VGNNDVKILCHFENAKSSTPFRISNVPFNLNQADQSSQKMSRCVRDDIPDTGDTNRIPLEGQFTISIFYGKISVTTFPNQRKDCFHAELSVM
jgi:hypothetical protein